MLGHDRSRRPRPAAAAAAEDVVAAVEDEEEQLNQIRCSHCLSILTDVGANSQYTIDSMIIRPSTLFNMDG